MPDAQTTASATASTVLADLDAVRARTLDLVSHLSTEDLERQIDPILSPLVWDLGHIAAYEDLWLVHRHGGLPLRREDLAALYDAFETPRAVRGELELLDRAQAEAELVAVRERVREVVARRGVGDGTVFEMVLRHELQHTETMLQAMRHADLLPPTLPGPPQLGEGSFISVPAGEHLLGARAEGFAYDNERPAHRVEVPAFRIATRPVTNASWLTFTEGGGYERREWWSDEGWAWKQDDDSTCHPAIRDGHPDAPVCHVSWFEADAFARAHGARLPTEAEWERAATWHQQTVGASAGNVWEWTSTTFSGYPGFVAHPYREYSEVFFDRGYRVLRGGSWATHPRVATTTFRNWDLPQRRQIFAGVRLAHDEEAH
ncbi:SUMF1/EgtB/PvdO family nonheme iron enzyme [Paraconexibacter sp.]|uniref:SUMF1/EgtB/PvdO family nonheme iron enzyme n=1 Tax=Paraconexibacter sp. TaxID=2949640 RepID=UPI003567E7FE